MPMVQNIGGGLALEHGGQFYRIRHGETAEVPAALYEQHKDRLQLVEGEPLTVGQLSNLQAGEPLPKPEQDGEPTEAAPAPKKGKGKASV